jgi:diaminohydroxyphosphoribosylaminopyrimidine deaminase/5-amino-6-(5-phosphoribosylamino)uracil reductase
VLVGVGTVLADDPELTARNGSRTTYPMRIVADSRARTPLSAKVLSQSSGQTIVAVTAAAPVDNVRKLEEAGARILLVDDQDVKVSLPALLRTLGQMKLTSVLIEGGGRIAASAVSAGVVDKVMVFIAPKIVGGESARTAVGGLGVETIADALELGEMTVRKVGCDLLVEAYPCSRG